MHEGDQITYLIWCFCLLSEGTRTSSEFFDGSDFTGGPELPTPLEAHCAVEFAPMRVFLTDDNSQWIADFTGDSEEPQWTQLPDMERGRFYMGCGAVRSPNGGIDIMVIGGNYNGRTDTVEMFNTLTGVRKNNGS